MHINIHKYFIIVKLKFHYLKYINIFLYLCAYIYLNFIFNFIFIFILFCNFTCIYFKNEYFYFIKIYFWFFLLLFLTHTCSKFFATITVYTEQVPKQVRNSPKSMENLATDAKPRAHFGPFRNATSATSAKLISVRRDLQQSLWAHFTCKQHINKLRAYKGICTQFVNMYIHMYIHTHIPILYGYIYAISFNFSFTLRFMHTCTYVFSYIKQCIHVHMYVCVLR